MPNFSEKPSKYKGFVPKIASKNIKIKIDELPF